MAYGTLKVDNITFTSSGVDKTITVSGIVTNISGNITATGTIQGAVIVGTTTVSGALVTGDAGAFGTLTGNTAGFTTITGTTVTGTTINAQSGVFTAWLSGATVTGNAGVFGTLTGNTAGFTTITGTTVTGTTVNAVSGDFTTRLSGAVITGNAGEFSTLTGNTAGFTTITGTTVTGTTARFSTVSGVSDVFTTNLSGATITGNTVLVSNITGVSGVFTTRVSGATVTGNTGAFENVSGISGVFTQVLSGVVITGDAGRFTAITGVSGVYTNLSGATVTGNTVAATSITGVTGVFTSCVSGTTVTGDTGAFTNLTGIVGVFTTSVSVTGTISGITVTGTSGQFTNITADTTNFTTATGVTASFTTITGVTVTGTTANFTSGNFISFSGGTYIATSGVFASGTAANPSISILGDADTGVYSPGANQLAITTSGTGRLFVNSAGRVGIGTASSIAPSAPLDDFHIASTDPAVLLEETDAGTDEKYWRIRAEGSILRFEGVNDAFNTSTSWLNVTRSTGARTADNIAFATGTVEKVRINAAGQVLIGSQGVSYFTPLSAVSAPTMQVHQVGSPQAQSVIANWGTGNDVGPSLSLCRADSGAIGTYTPAIGSADVLGNIRFNGSDGTKFIEGVKISAVADGTWATDSGPTSLRFSTTPSGTAVVERLRITASGRVGIGTNLGTWTPGATLDVRSGSDNTAIEEIAAFARPDGAVRASINKGVISGNGISFGTTTNHPLALRTNTTERIVIGASGTTTLTSDASTSPFIVNIDASEVARIDSSGRLLVGTSSAVVIGSFTPTLQNVGSSTQNSSIALSTFSTTDDVEPRLIFTKSATATIGVNALVANGESLGSIRFHGSQTAGYVQGATIECYVDGDPETAGDTGDMPARIVLKTTPDGSQTSVERLRVTSAGRLGLATTAPAALAHIAGNTIVSNVDLANASYDNISFSVAAEETLPAGLFFSPDGRKMFVTGSTGDDVNEYTLSTPWNVSTATYVTVFSVSGQDSNPQDLYFRNDGKKLYIMGSANDVVYQYSLSTPWSIASASYDSISFAVGTQDSTAVGVFFKPDGLTLYMLGSTNDTVYQYTLSTAWNVSTAVLSGSFSVLAQETSVNAISFTADGSRMFIMGSTGDDVNIYNLTTPWDITTASFVTVFSVAAQDTGPNGLFVKPDGTKFYIVGNTNDTVYQYTIPSATIDLTGTTNINGNANIAQNLTINGEIVGAGALTLSTADTGGTPTPRVNITADGKVGIGITTPSSLLHLAASNPTIHIQPSADTESSEIAFRNAANTQTRGFVKYTNTDDSLSFRTNLSERARIDSSGRLLVGASTARTNFYNSTNSSTVLVENAAGTFAATAAFIRNNNSSGGSEIILAKTNSTVTGGIAAVVAGDDLGGIVFQGSDGTEFVEGGRIEVTVDGTPGANDMPGRIVLFTTPDGTATSVERFRITNDGVIAYGQPAPAAVNATATLTVANLKAGIITSTSAAATDMTLPTGTDTQAGFNGTYDNFTFEWSVINTGPSLVRVLANTTTHIVVGSGSVATGTSGRFATRRTAANTFTSYRLS